MKSVKDWTGNNLSVFKTLGSSAHSAEKREVRDYYATDPVAIDNLLSVERFDQNIWESACGGGHLSNVLKSRGYTVFESDILKRYNDAVSLDFLSHEAYEYKQSFDIITNPPYKFALEFCEQAIKLCKNKVAMFLKLQFLEGKKRYEFFKNYPPTRIWVYSWRIQCAKNGDFASLKSSSAQAYAWYIWERGFYGVPGIGWIG